MTHPALARALDFADTIGARVPVLMAPMAGVSPPALAAAVADAGGVGACGALMLEPGGIAEWSAAFRARSNGAFQLNTWIPDPDPPRDAAAEARLRGFLEGWGPEVPPGAADAARPDFDAQCAAMLAAGPAIISSIMGLYPARVVAEIKRRRIRWFATVTTLGEARAAAAAGADVLVAQGVEAGGHRGAFEARDAEARGVGLFSLLPAIVDAVDLPVVATGGIADARGVAAALMLGASGVQVGTALLRSPEAALPPSWAAALGDVAPEDTALTRAFSGRAGRALRTAYAVAAAAPEAPAPAPYPVQLGLTAAMRGEALERDDVARMSAWAGQSAAMAGATPAARIVGDLWEGAVALLDG